MDGGLAKTMPKQIVVIGKNGQIGSALVRLLGDRAVAFSHNDADFSNYEDATKALSVLSPRVIINAAAYTAVDMAESEESEANKGNVAMPSNLAKYCFEHNIPLVHYSTDYVFSGEGNKPHTEDEAPSPINVYGKTKLAGEEAIRDSGCDYMIFRTSWVFDSYHKNFLNTMLHLGLEREELSVVSDQIGAPTYAPDIAEATIVALGNFKTGTYHLCNKGETSWYDFALRIFEIAKEKNMELKIKRVNPITSAQYPTPAMRPLNSRLDCSRAKSILNVELPDWQESLVLALEEAIESNKNTA